MLLCVFLLFVEKLKEHLKSLDSATFLVAAAMHACTLLNEKRDVWVQRRQLYPRSWFCEKASLSKKGTLDYVQFEL